MYSHFIVLSDTIVYIYKKEKAKKQAAASISQQMITLEQHFMKLTDQRQILITSQFEVQMLSKSILRDVR